MLADATFLGRTYAGQIICNDVSSAWLWEVSTVHCSKTQRSNYTNILVERYGLKIVLQYIRL